AHGTPHHGFQRFIRRHLTGVDDAHLRHVKRAAQSADHRGQHEDKELEVRGGITGEKHTVFTVADGALNETELGRSQPATKQIHPEEYSDRGHVEKAFCGRRIDVVAEDEFKVRESVIASKSKIVTKEHEHGRVSQRLAEDGKINTLDARAKGQPT